MLKDLHIHIERGPYTLEWIEKFIGGCMYIENAPALSEESVEKIREMIAKYGKQIVIVLEGDYEKMDDFFRTSQKSGEADLLQDPLINEGGMERDEKAGVETRQYVISRAGSDGKLWTRGRNSQYYNGSVGRHDLQRSGDAFYFRSPGAVFL